MASTYLKRTNGTPTNDKIGTISVWIKRSKLGTDQRIHMNYADGNNYGYIRCHSDNPIEIYAVTSGSTNTLVRTNRLLRDTSGWYHLVVAIDTTQGTASNRLKIYINGVQETSFASSTYPTQNVAHPLLIASGSNHHTVGSAENGTSSFDGSMSHYHKCDGTALAPTVFGETDSTTGEWKIKTSPSFTVGNTGYTILKDGNTITDQSSNSNNFTLGAGTLTKTEDNPSNVFATWNPLDGNFGTLGGGAFTYGNNKFNSEAGANKLWARSTLGMTSGKYYFEMKVQTPSNNCAIGISDRGSPNFTTELGAGAYDYSYQSANSGNKYNNGSQSSYGNTYTTNDIVSCALDLDNLKVYFGKNGTWQNSGDPTSGSTGTGAAFTVAAPSSTNGGAYFFCGGDLSGANNVRLLANFGNGIFADNDPVSSAGTNASGNGIFEYDVPTGFTALSTKGLNL